MNIEKYKELMEYDLTFDSFDEAIDCCESDGLFYERNFHSSKTGNLKERLAIVSVGDGFEVIQYSPSSSKWHVIPFQREFILGGKPFELRSKPLLLAELISRLGEALYGNKHFATEK